MNLFKFYFFSLFFLTQSFAVDIKITDIKIISKKNGIFLTIRSNYPIPMQTATGWY